MKEKPSKTAETGALWILALCATIMVGLMVRREFFSGEAVPAVLAGAELEEALLDETIGIELGRSDGAVRVVEFVDLECPACALYHRDVVSSLLETLEQRKASVSFRVVLFPLPMHPFANIAAQAAVCAHQQGRFREFVTVAFAAQREFREEPWLRLSENAKVHDVAAFARCLQDSAVRSTIVAGEKLAMEAHVRETPSIAVNGRLLPRLPSTDQLLALIDRLLDGDDPFR